MQPNVSINHDGIFSNMSVLYSNSRIFVIPLYIFNGRKQTLVDMIGILSGLRMRGLHDKPHLLAKLHICGRVNYADTHILCLCLSTSVTIPSASCLKP